MSGQTPPPPSKQPPRQQGWRPSARQVAGVILLVLALVFIFENTKSVKVRLIVPEVKAPLFVALLIAAVLGGLVTLLIQWRVRRGKGGAPPGG
jgi:uncharacterized integral membrane protein